MSTTTTTEILSSPRLATFWLFEAGSELHLGVFERGEDAESGALRVGRIAGGRLGPMREVALLGPEVRAVEAAEVGDGLVLALEMNRERAGEAVRVPLAALADRAQVPAKLESLGELSLSAAQVAAVRLPITEHWNVAGPLLPERWIFSPRPVHGGPVAQVVANTADGQSVLVLGPEGVRNVLAVPDAAEPRAWHEDGRLVVAFLRFGGDYRPFWALDRYAGSRRPGAGALCVATARAEVTVLSDALGIGPVTAFAAARRPQGDEALFAVRKGSASSEVLAVVRDGTSGWRVSQTWPLDGPADRIAVAHHGAAWHVVVATRTDAGSSLRYLARADAAGR